MYREEMEMEMEMYKGDVWRICMWILGLKGLINVQ